MISIIIPAHNEEAVIGRCLEALVRHAQPDELDIVVVCNGCIDSTAAVARTFGQSVRVIETDVPSKTNALNLGDQATQTFPRLYLDADVVLDTLSVRAIAETLSDGQVLAAAPRMEMVFLEDCHWSVRAVYRFWEALPFVQEGMMGAGAYAVSSAGRGRFGRFPDIIADDGFVRLHFTAEERVEVLAAISRVRAPSKFSDLIRIRSRSRLGVYQLRQRFPELFLAERRSKGYGQALARIFRNPALYLPALPFLAVSFLSRIRAMRQVRRLDEYVWERDRSSRA